MDKNTQVWPTLIGIHGAVRSGKDTASTHLGKVGFERFGFADNLRATLFEVNPRLMGVTLVGLVSKGGWDIALKHPVHGDVVQFLMERMDKVGQDITGAPVDVKATLLALNPPLEGIHLTELIDRVGYEAAKDHPLYGTAVRGLLQRWGTDVGRDHFGVNVWVDLVGKKIAASSSERFVISDVRFPQEAEWVREQGGVVWQVNRPGYGAVNGHASEQTLPPALVDLYIENDFDLETLWGRVDLALQTATDKNDYLSV